MSAEYGQVIPHRGDISMAIAVEITAHGRGLCLVGHERDRGGESTRAIAAEERHVLGCICRENVRLPVLVGIQGGDLRRVKPGGSACDDVGLGESPGAVTREQVEVEMKV